MSNAECYEVLKKTTDLCGAITNTSACHSASIINYNEIAYCAFESQYTGISLSIIALLYYFLMLSTTADSFFTPALANIVHMLKISHNVAGVTFLALGNGAADIFSSIAALFGTHRPHVAMALGAILGSGIFVTMAVSAIVMLIQGFRIMQRPFLRDSVFYTASLFFTFVFLWYERVTLIQSIGFVLLYIAYVSTVIMGGWLRKWTLRKRDKNKLQVSAEAAETNDPQACQMRRVDSVIEELQWEFMPHPSSYLHDLGEIKQELQNSSDGGLGTDCDLSTISYNPNGKCEDRIVSEPDDPKDTLSTKAKLCAHLILRGVSPPYLSQWKQSTVLKRMYIIISIPAFFLLNVTIPVYSHSGIQEDIEEEWNKPLSLLICLVCPPSLSFLTTGAANWMFSIPVGIVLFIALHFSSTLEKPPVYYKLFAYLGFAASIMWIYRIAMGIVEIVDLIAISFGLSDALLGLTLIAWANSSADLASNISVARQGYARMAMSACLGTPLINLLIGIGLSFVVICARNGGVLELQVSEIELTICSLLLVNQVISLLCVTFVLKFKTDRRYAIFLILLYIVFIVLAVLIELKVLTL